MGDRSSSSRPDTTSRSSRAVSNRSRPFDLARQSRIGYDRSHSTHDVADQGASGSGNSVWDFSTGEVSRSNPGYDRSYSTHDVASQSGSPSGYDRAHITHDAARMTSGDYARSRMTPEEIALSKEYSRKETANRRYSKGYIITQEEKNARYKYQRLAEEYYRNPAEISSYNQQDGTGVSEHTRPHYEGQEPSESGYYYPQGQGTWDEWERQSGVS